MKRKIILIFFVLVAPLLCLYWIDNRDPHIFPCSNGSQISIRYGKLRKSGQDGIECLGIVYKYRKVVWSCGMATFADEAISFRKEKYVSFLSETESSQELNIIQKEIEWRTQNGKPRTELPKYLYARLSKESWFDERDVDEFKACYLENRAEIESIISKSTIQRHGIGFVFFERRPAD